MSSAKCGKLSSHLFTQALFHLYLLISSQNSKNIDMSSFVMVPQPISPNVYFFFCSDWVILHHLVHWLFPVYLHFVAESIPEHCISVTAYFYSKISTCFSYLSFLRQGSIFLCFKYVYNCLLKCFLQIITTVKYLSDYSIILVMAYIDAF